MIRHLFIEYSDGVIEFDNNESDIKITLELIESGNLDGSPEWEIVQYWFEELDEND